MAARITSLELTGFRGATRTTRVDFDGEKSVVMIFGENGTGKSTLVDAIDAVTNGSLGSVQDRKPSNAPWQFLPSIDREAEDLAVKLGTSDGKEYRARLGSREVEVDGPDDGPTVHVLRRNQLLKMTEERPAERYKAIEAFVDVGSVEAAERTLREAARGQSATLDSLIREQLQAQEWLDGTWERNRTDDEEATDAASWAEARAGEDTHALEARARHLADLDGAVTVADGALAALETARRVGREAADAVAKAEAELEEATRDDGRRDELVAVLEAAQAYVAPPNDVDTCPVCAQSVEADELRVRLQRELAGLRAVRQAAEALRGAQGGVRLAAQKLDQARASLVRAAREVATVARALGAETFTDAAGVSASLDGVADEDPDRALEAAQALIQAAVKDRLRFRAEQGRLTARVALKGEIAGRLRAVNRDADEREAAEALLLRLNEAVTVVERERKAYVAGVLDDIRDEVNRLYERIHPDEGLALEELEVSRRASLTQKAAFAGRSGVPPQGYYSESHLDTLGFCFWIALAKRAGAGRAVVVLDDVFTSVDWDHFERITALLDEEAGSFTQLIIATHSRQWYERYRRRPSNVHLLTLEGWSPDDGVLVYEARTHTEALAAAIEARPFDRQVAASKAGVLLEEVLLRVATVYQCSLPLRETPKFTLSELFSGTKKVFRVAEIDRVVLDGSGEPAPVFDDDGAETDDYERETTALRPLYEAAAAWLNIRNETGAHHNVSGMLIPDADVQTFAEAALALAEGVTCPGCGCVPDKPRDGTFRGCPCPAPLRSKLTPYQRP